MKKDLNVLSEISGVLFVCVAMFVYEFWSLTSCKNRNYLDDVCTEYRGSFDGLEAFLVNIQKDKKVTIDESTINMIKEIYVNDTIEVKIWLHRHMGKKKIGTFFYYDISAISVNGEIEEEHSWINHHIFNLVSTIVFGLGTIFFFVLRIVYKKRQKRKDEK